MVLAILALNAFAVTDDEMDQARAIVGKFYVRYIDNGSGYLDDWTPTSMKDLEGKLNAKGKELLTQFKKGGYPTDYASWDKDKLVAYWGDSFFKENSSVLDNKAAGNSLAKRDIKKAINGMKVGIPAASTPSADGESDDQNVADAIADSARMAQETTVDEVLSQQEEAIAQAENEMLKDEEDEGEKGSGTWVYVMILAILVAIVIFLVVYASRTMKGDMKKEEELPGASDYRGEEKEYGRFTPKSGSTSKKEEIEDVSIQPAYVAESGITAETRMREKYAQTLASKSEEIRSLNRQLSELESLAAQLKKENRILKNELEQIRHQTPHPHVHPHSVGEHHHDSRPEAGAVKEVYLGRVNARGVFVRADRQAVKGQSIYKLTTTDGLEGKFSLIQNPDIEEQVLEDPGKWLAGGCFAKDIFDTDGNTAVKTEMPGKAVFRDGAWWVEKKAKIRYE